jgi:aryl-alcohol dehydrogenase-like predicted oxidoreductase
MTCQPIGKNGLITFNLTLGTMIFGEGASRSTPKNEDLKTIDQYLNAGVKVSVPLCQKYG